MPDIKIRYVVDSSQLQDAQEALQGLSKEDKELVESFKKVNAEAAKAGKGIEEAGKKGKDSMNSLGSTMKTVGASIAAYFSVQALKEFALKVIDVTSTFQKFKAVLTNTLGSGTAADIALAQISDQAAKTNFSVQELTETYIKFANRGIKLTNDEMTKLADIANSTGKSIDQLTEAALDSFTGENERLKEFGITAKKTGETTQFTFKGITTEVKNSQKAVKDYLFSLGDLEGVTGSTAAISKTLGGQISNLGDSFDTLFLTIGKNTDGIISRGIGLLSDFVGWATKALKSTEQAQADAANSQAGAYIDQFAKMDEAYQKGQEALLQRQIEVSQKAADKLAAVRKAQADEVRRSQEASFGYSSEVTLKKTPEEIKFEQNVITKKKELELVQKFFADKAKTEAEGQKALTDKELDALRDAKLKELKELEAYAVRKAQYEEKSENEILDIHIKYANLRLEVQRRSELDRKGDRLGILENVKEQYSNEMDLANEKAAQELRLNKALSADLINNDENLYKFGDDLDEKYTQKKIDRAEKVFQKDREKAQMKKDLRQAEFDLAVAIAEGLFQLNTQQNQAELATNDKARQDELKRVGDNKQAQAFINAKFDKQNAAIKTKQAQADKAQAIFGIVLATALGVAKASPVVPLMALVAALGAVQLAVAAARPIPKFARGTEYVDGPGTSVSDSILARLSVGERVVPAHVNRQLAGIPNADLPKLVAMNYDAFNKQVSPSGDSALYSELVGLRKDLKRIPINQINMDEKGFKKFIFKGDSVMESLNNQFPS